jgi:hypothetical protein
VEQLVARQPHELKVAGSSPASAISRVGSSMAEQGTLNPPCCEFESRPTLLADARVVCDGDAQDRSSVW